MSDLVKPDDTRDALRKIGGLLFGFGVLMLVNRKEDDWSDFVLLIVALVPAVILYGGAIATRKATGELRSWQAVYGVLGLFFVLATFIQFLDLIGGNGSAPLNVFWITAVTAAFAVYAGVVVGIRYQLLLASLLAIVSWSALWDKILSGGLSEHLGVYRGLLGILAILLLIGGIAIWRSDANDGLLKFSELLTGAGIAAVVSTGAGITASVGLTPFFEPPHLSDGAIWSIGLLVISLGLVGAGSLIGVRGPVYIGAIGLILFTYIVAPGTGEVDTGLGAWTPVVLAAGVIAIAASCFDAFSLGDRPRKWVEKVGGG